MNTSNDDGKFVVGTRYHVHGRDIGTLYIGPDPYEAMNILQDFGKSGEPMELLRSATGERKDASVVFRTEPHEAYVCECNDCKYAHGMEIGNQMPEMEHDDIIGYLDEHYDKLRRRIAYHAI